jgi:hypothetical protein
MSIFLCKISHKDYSQSFPRVRTQEAAWERMCSELAEIFKVTGIGTIGLP